MIYKSGNVINAEIRLYGEPLAPSIIEKQTNGLFKNENLPINFKYNGSWSVNHKCLKCGEKCNFGLEFNSSISNHPKTSFIKTKYICSKYFDNPFLNSINNLFNKIELIKVEKNIFIVQKGKFDPDYPITSSIKLIHYKCEKCQTQYLSLMNISFPQVPERGCPQGIIGNIDIDEIIEINIDNNYLFTDLLKKSIANSNG